MHSKIFDIASFTFLTEVLQTLNVEVVVGLQIWSINNHLSDGLQVSDYFVPKSLMPIKWGTFDF